MGHFERDGIAFDYPENWTVSPEEYDSGWGVAVFSPATAFLSVTLDESGVGSADVADAALEAMREEYTQLDAEPVNGTIAGLPAAGYDVEFITIDLGNTCRIRGVTLGRGSLLVHWQACDREPENIRVLEAIVQSMRVSDDE